uniref:TOG domain-containing protein n=1 Tax=Heterorhabditis bacteriophora TaxID=37862 RepID=A0A1I7WQE9_HETBA
MDTNKISKGTMNMLKARSEGNLSDERENSPPINYDDVPIRPAKNGKYLDDYPLSPPDRGSLLVKKSTSHHSLPITSTHVSLKNTQSVPTKKPHCFLKSSSSCKVKPAAPNKPVSREVTKTQMNGASKTGNGITSNNSTGGSVQLALKKIDSEDWNDKVDGIHMIANLSSSNPKQVTDHMHEIVVALLNECKNLRSSVSRVALWCTGVLTENVKGKMDTELDKLCAILMHKAGDVSNAFIREDAHEALEKVVKYASAGKALSGIISAGSKSKNNTIRASCASFVCNLVGRMGSEAVLNSADQVAKLIPQVIAFCKDPNPVVRQHGKQILLNLSQESCFDRMLKKHVSDADYRTVKGILSEIEKKGGIDSLDSTSISLSSSLSRNGSVKKAVPRKLPDNVQLDLDEIRTDLTAAGLVFPFFQYYLISTNWERRLGGLKRFDEMCVNSSRAVASDTKLIEAFMARLNDINSKVSLEGMDTYLVTLPIMSKLFSTEAHLKAVLNQLILALMSHLSSKSDDHKHLAQTCLQETVKQIEPACLSPALAAATKKANVKQKPFMLNIFNLVALPILWDSIRCGVADPESKKAVTDFAKGLVKLMGERVIMDHAAMELDPPRRKILESLIRIQEPVVLIDRLPSFHGFL